MPRESKSQASRVETSACRSAAVASARTAATVAAPMGARPGAGHADVQLFNPSDRLAAGELDPGEVAFGRQPYPRPLAYLSPAAIRGCLAGLSR
jgi:hypothetical protein